MAVAMIVATDTEDGGVKITAEFVPEPGTDEEYTGAQRFILGIANGLISMHSSGENTQPN